MVLFFLENFLPMKIKNLSKIIFNVSLKSLLVVLLILSLVFQNNLIAFAATFTAGMAKREAPGPFAGGAVVQSDIENTLTGDQIFALPGNTLSGEFDEYFDQCKEV